MFTNAPDWFPEFFLACLVVIELYHLILPRLLQGLVCRSGFQPYFSVMHSFLWFWMGILYKTVLVMLVFFKAPLSSIQLGVLVQSVQFEKHEKHTWRSVTFSKIAGLKVTLIHRCLSYFSNCTDVTKLRKASPILLWKMFIWIDRIGSSFSSFREDHFLFW